MKRTSFGADLVVAGAVLFAVVGCGSSPDTTDNGDASTDGGDTSAVATLGDPCDKAGALACNGHAQKLELLCDGSKWVANGTCPGQQVCDTRVGLTAGSCQDPAPGCGDKTPGAAFCDGTIRHQCGPDLLTETSATCIDAQHCADGSGDKCAICKTNETTCDGPSLKLCSPDHLSFITIATCESSALCVPGASTCLSSTCTTGSYQCTGDILQQCNDTHTGWTTVKTCAPGLCDAADGKCYDCSPGTTGCDGNTPASCDSSHHWVDNGAPCSGATPNCVGGTCTATPVTSTVTFPSSGSMTSDGTLGSGGSRFNLAGTYVQEFFARSAPVSELDLSFTMSDAMSGCASGVSYSFKVSLNGTTVGAYSITASGSDHPVSKTLTFGAISPPSGGGFNVRFESLESVCSGGGNWGWYPGGSLTMK